MMRPVMRFSCRREHAVAVRRALTLLEVVLSMGLLVVLSSMTYWFYGSVLETRQRGTEKTYEMRLVRVVLDRLAREIRQASLITTDDRVGIRGEAERIWLSTIRVPSKELSKVRRTRDLPPPGEYDLTKIEYKIARHPDIVSDRGNWELPLGLARVEIMVPRPDSIQTGEAHQDQKQVVGGDQGDAAFEQQLAEEEFVDDVQDTGAQLKPRIEWEQLYAPEIRYLRFCYFDGRTWWDDWDVAGENPLPQLVMVTAGFVGRAAFEKKSGRDDYNEKFCECLNRDPPDCEPLPLDQFSTIVRVTQADPLFRSRITRETQAVVDELTSGTSDEGDTGDGGDGGGGNSGGGGG